MTKEETKEEVKVITEDEMRKEEDVRTKDERLIHTAEVKEQEDQCLKWLRRWERMNRG